MNNENQTRQQEADKVRLAYFATLKPEVLAKYKLIEETVRSLEKTDCKFIVFALVEPNKGIIQYNNFDDAFVEQGLMYGVARSLLTFCSSVFPKCHFGMFIKDKVLPVFGALNNKVTYDELPKVKL